MFKTPFSSALWRLLCFAAFALCFGRAANAQQQTVLSVSALPPRAEGLPAQFRLTLSNPATQRLTVRFVTSPGFGTGQFGPAGARELPSNGFESDYNRVDRDVTFETNSADLIVDVPTKSDLTYEFDESFNVFIDNPRYNGQFAQNISIDQRSAVGVIVNDDDPPVVNLIAPEALVEGDTNNRARQNQDFSINLARIAERPVELSLSTRDGSATSGPPNADYVGVNGDLVTIAPGTLQQLYSVVIIGDDIYEGDEAYTLVVTTLSPPVTPGNGTAPSIAVGTITDNDLPTYVIDDSQASVVEGQQASFKISLIDRRTGLPISAKANIDFQYVFQDGTATFGPSNNNSPFDYSDNNANPFTRFGPGTFRIRPGQRDFTLTVPTVDDNIQESVETFNLIISAQPTNAQSPEGTGNVGNGSITDNDSAPQITANSARSIEGTGDPTVLTFTVNLTSVSAGRSVTVDYQTVPQSPAPGIADPNTDYVPTTGRLTFAANQASASFTVPIVADSINEPDETFRVRLFNPGNATFPNNAAELILTGTIVDDDSAGTISVGRSAIDVPENVGGGIVNVPVNFAPNGVPARPVTVDFTTIAGTASQTGQRDYFGKTGRLTFSPQSGNTSLAIPIEIVNDNISEGNETFTVRLTAVDGADLLPGANETVVTIIDDEKIPLLRISPTQAQYFENVGSPRFTVSLLTRSQSPVTVNYAFQDGTATNGTDYAGTNGSFTFQPGGDTSFFLPFDINDDNVAELRENFTVLFSGNPDAGTGLTNFAFEGGRDRATVNIVDNDPAPELTIRGASIPEGNDGDINTGAVLTFPVTLSRPSSRPVSFSYSTLNLRQQDCTPANGCDVASDNDYASVRNVVVTIPAGAVTATIVVRVAPDALNEFNEQFAVVARSLVNAVPSVTPVPPTTVNPRPNPSFGTVAYGNILNDDIGGAVTITGPFTTADGNTATGNLIEGYQRDATNTVIGTVGNFRVTLPTPAGRPVTVKYSIVGGSATAADINDLTTGPGNGQVTFFAGDTTRNIALRAAADNLSEPQETLTVSISIDDRNGNNSYTVNPSANTASTNIIDRTPSVQSFAPSTGFSAYGNVAASRVTINGRLLRTDGNPRVDAVIFSGGAEVGRGGIQYTDDNTIVVSVPNGAKSGPITLRLTDDTAAKPSRLNFATTTAGTPNFFVQPVITSFTPTVGVRGGTSVTITGRNFQDGLNPVTGVQFSNGAVVNLATTAAPEGVTVNSDTQITVSVPLTAVTGPISVIARNGVGPASQAAFTVVTASNGNIRFEANPDLNPILEDSTGSITQPVRNFDGATTPFHRPYLLTVNPATQTTGANAGQPITQTGITITIQVTDNTDTGRNPQIVVRADTANAGRPTFLVNSTNATNGTVTLELLANYNPANPIEVAIIDSGTDDLPPVVGTAGAATVSVTARITKTDNPVFFPLTPSNQIPFVRVERRQAVTNANRPVVVFAANTVNDFSVPYSSNNSGSVPLSSAFETTPSAGNYTVYRFNVANQRNSRVDNNGNTGGDFVVVQPNESLQRGVGYRLVTGSQQVRLKAQGTGLQTISANSFALNLTRNVALAANASGSTNASNGYNFIGFPFDATQFSGVNFNNSTVIVNGTARPLSQAVAAGLINPQLFTVGADGTLTAVAGDPIIEPFKAYFVQIFTDNLTVNLNDPIK